MDGLMRLRRPEQVAELRGLTVKQVLGLDLKEAAAKAAANGESTEAPDPVAVVAAEGGGAGIDPGAPGSGAEDVPGSESEAAGIDSGAEEATGSASEPSPGGDSS
jgi:hypothetical protein